jgi:hypothetical protein
MTLKACCPVVHRKVKRDVHWLGKELQKQRREVRRLQNKFIVFIDPLTTKVIRVRCKKVKWAFNKFKPYKLPGPDGTLPAHL